MDFNKNALSFEVFMFD